MVVCAIARNTIFLEHSLYHSDGLQLILSATSMKNIMKSVAFLALIVFAFSTSAFSKGETSQFSIHNGTSQNVGIVTVYGSTGTIGQIAVPGPGLFTGPVNGAMTGLLVNDVVVAKGTTKIVTLANGHSVTVNNVITIPDISENN